MLVDQIDNQSSSATGVLHLNGETCNGAVHHLGETSTATMSQSDDNPTTGNALSVNHGHFHEHFLKLIHPRIILAYFTSLFSFSIPMH